MLARHVALLALVSVATGATAMSGGFDERVAPLGASSHHRRDLCKVIRFTPRPA
ncbi:MAG: hypothetical protein M3364_05970 [Actinomycetota bacterium]|nr:hypothetical protein [Actinomycetota bacterium]